MLWLYLKEKQPIGAESNQIVRFISKNEALHVKKRIKD
jgi:hypothetical protein